jgi:hypothetical protein
MSSFGVPKVHGLILLVGLAVGTAIRLWLIAQTPWQWYAVDRLFDQLAWHLAQGLGFTLDGTTPSAHVGPLYPALLSVWYALVGHRPEWVPYVHVGLDVVTGLFLFWGGRRLFGPGVAALATCLFSLSPAYWTYDLRIRSEILLTLLVTAWLWAAILCVHGERRRTYALSGLLGGLTLLCKPVMIPAAMLLAWLPLVLDWGQAKRWVPKFALYLGCLVLVMIPWTVRNYYALGTVIPVSTGMGVGLWMGSDPISRGSWPMPLPIETQIWETAGITPLAYPHAMYEVELDRALFSQGLERIQAHPFRYLVLVAGRVIDLWIGNAYYLFNAEPTLRLGLQTDVAERGVLVASYSLLKRLVLLPAILLLALWTCWVHREQGLRVLPCWLLPLGLTLGYAPFTSESGRYVLPVLPCLFLLASWSLVFWAVRIGPKTSSKSWYSGPFESL